MRDLHSIPTRRSSDLWKWRTDPRLRLPSLVRFTEDQLESILQALVAPVLAIRAEQGMVTQAYLDQRSKHIADATIKTVEGDRKSTRLNSSHVRISYAVFCLKKKKKNTITYNN